MYDNPPPSVRQQNNRPANRMMDVLHLIEHGAYVIPLCWSDTPGSLTCSCPHGHKERRGEVNAQGVREDVRWRQVGKVPLVEWQKYQSDPPDEDQIIDWWSAWPNANVAILLEPSGLLVVDIDSHAAEQEVRALGIGEGAQVVRGGKLKHIYYRRPEGIDITRRTRVGESGRIDILPSGYVVAPPSVHGSGLAYEWGSVALADVEDLPLPPAWVLEMLDSASESEDIRVYSGDLSGMVEGFEPHGKQEERIASALSALSPHCNRKAWIKIGAMLADGFNWGEGDERLHNLNRGFSLWAEWSKGPADNPYPMFDVDTAAADWNNLVKRQKERRQRLGMLKDLARGQGRALEEDERKMGPATVASLFRAAHLSPHGWTDPHPPYGLIEECKEVGSAWVADADIAVEPERMNVIPMTRAAKPKLQPIEEPEHLRMMPPVDPPKGGGGGNGGGRWEYPASVVGGSDMDLARLVARYVQNDSPAGLVSDEGDVWRYDPNLGCWGKVESDEVEAAAVGLDYIIIKRRNSEGEWTSRTKYLSASNMRSIAGAVSAVTYHKDFFVNAPKGLQFQNAFVRINDDGNIDVLPPGPEHGQRLGVPVDYKPYSSCPKWTRSLEMWLTPKNEEGVEEGDPDWIDPIKARDETIQFIQEFTGACLMGIAPQFQKMVVAYGEGANGKSVLIDVISGLFPKEVTSNFTPQELTGNDVSNNVAELQGKRLNYFADIPANELVNSSKLKALVTGDKMSGRAVYQKTKRFTPEAGFLFSANNLPASRDTSKGFWRRVVPIPFTNEFKAGDKGVVKKYDQVILREEIEGLYTWALMGAQRLMQRGHYIIPEICDRLQETWKRYTTPIQGWLMDCVGKVDETKLNVAKPQHWSTAAMMYPSYRAWCSRTGHKPYNSTNFSRQIAQYLPESRRGNVHDCQVTNTNRRRIYPVRMYADEILERVNAGEIKVDQNIRAALDDSELIAIE